MSIHIRQLGEVVQLPIILVDKYAKLGRTLEQQKGFALDEIEKNNFEKTGKWIATTNKEPYDISNENTFVDFKLCTRKSLTVQNSECIFGDKNSSYTLFIYAIEEDGLSACYVGQVKYCDISKYMQPSRKPNSHSHFCFLDEIQHLIQ